MLSTANQAYVFLSTVYAGFFIGLIYDFCRMIRRIFRTGRFFTGLLDLSFWLIMGFSSFLVIFHVNSGEVRVYTVVGFAAGWGLYALVLSPYVMKILGIIHKAVTRAVSAVFSVIAWPFKMAVKILRVPVRFFASLCKKLAKGIKGVIHGGPDKKNNKNT